MNVFNQRSRADRQVQDSKNKKSPKPKTMELKKKNKLICLKIISDLGDLY